MPNKEDVTILEEYMGLPKRAQPQVQWIQNAQKELGGNTMEDVVITEEMVKKQAKKMKNWTALGKMKYTDSV